MKAVLNTRTSLLWKKEKPWYQDQLVCSKVDARPTLVHWVVTWFGWFQFQLIKAKLEPGLISRTQTGTGLKTGSGFGLELKPTRTDSGTGTIIFDNKLFLGKKVWNQGWTISFKLGYLELKPEWCPISRTTLFQNWIWSSFFFCGTGIILILLKEPGREVLLRSQEQNDTAKYPLVIPPFLDF